MSELTDTHTAIELPPPGQDRPVVGVLVVFSAGRALLVPHRVERRSRIGRDHEVEIHIDDNKASRAHAELLQAPGGVLVTDLASRNGTFVDGERVSAQQSFVPEGSVVRVGRTLLYVVRDVRPFEQPPLTDDFLIGGASLTEMRRIVATVGPSRVPVLVQGETGTGKELVAAALHRASARSGELVAVNCAALPGDLVESELFGHSRGAFSSSDRARKGLFRTADGGTLLLDEIGDLPLAAQAKLLRVLETGEVRSVGEDRAAVVDVRVVAATHRHLESMARDGRFRDDLYHRIASAVITLPPLRERREDVPLLAEAFVGSDSVHLTTRAVERLLLHDWPGNVRELRNVVAAAVTRARARGAGELDAEDLSLALRTDATTAGSDAELEQRVRAALTSCRGNVSQVARELGMRRPALYELFRKLDLDPQRFRG